MYKIKVSTFYGHPVSLEWYYLSSIWVRACVIVSLASCPGESGIRGGGDTGACTATGDDTGWGGRESRGRIFNDGGDAVRLGRESRGRSFKNCSAQSLEVLGLALLPVTLELEL